MVRFCFETVLMCILTSNLFIMLCTGLLRSKKLLIHIGYPILGSILILTTIRLLLPYEFPFTKTYWMPELLSEFISTVLLHPGIHIGFYAFSVWDIFVFVWILGSLFFLIRYLKLYFMTANTIKRYEGKGKSEDVLKYQELISSICQEIGKKNNFCIILFPDIQVPMYFGHKKPYIIMPQNLDCSQQDLYFILRHEMSHHFHHDIAIKHMVNLLSIFYWWNPICRYLKRECNTVLEMRIDDRLTKKDPVQTTAYLNCLINIAKKEIQNKQTYPMAIPICGAEPSTLIQRCTLLLKDPIKKKFRLFYLLLVLVFVGVFTTSFLFNYNAGGIPSYFEEKYIIPDKNDVYAIINNDGSYDVYVFGKYAETTDSLDFYPDDTPIYNRKD